MHGMMAVVVLGALLAVPGWASADEPDEEPTAGDIAREQIEALHDIEQAETDEEAEAAQQRFDDASMLEVKRRRAVVDDLIESGGKPGPSTRPSDQKP